MRLRLRLLLLLLLASSQLCNKKVIEKIFFPILSKDLFSKKIFLHKLINSKKWGKMKKLIRLFLEIRFLSKLLRKILFKKISDWRNKTAVAPNPGIDGSILIFSHKRWWRWSEEEKEEDAEKELWEKSKCWPKRGRC